ncbi:MAG: YIP1 family protein [Nanoarchaeota archaeon]|nr:YIP1 family protein [Nanoarchaeota archaeon]
MLKKIKEAIKTGISLLVNPDKGFSQLHRRPLESIVADYLRLLLVVGLAAGLFNMAYSFLKALYLDTFLLVNVDYLKMLNYSLSRSTSYIFFYVFAGTFLLFILSIILRLFVRQLRYTDLLKVMLYALFPYLLFSWLTFTTPALFIWSLFLFIVGLVHYKKTGVRKDSIQQRD